VELAKAAEKAGADGLLLLPPYLMVPSQEGLMAHIEAVCKATAIGVIVYSRDNAVLTEDSLAKLCERNPNLVGFKDGVGDIELMMRVYAKLGDRLTYVGGLPTAETFALPYLEMGVTTYSSAIYNFMPEWALSFYDAVRAKDHAKVMQGLKEFVLPYIAIRNENKGYAVSIVKAGMTAIGRSAGPVRAPLTELTPDQFGRLKKADRSDQTRLRPRFNRGAFPAIGCGHDGRILLVAIRASAASLFCRCRRGTALRPRRGAHEHDPTAFVAANPSAGACAGGQAAGSHQPRRQADPGRPRFFCWRRGASCA